MYNRRLSDYRCLPFTKRNRQRISASAPKQFRGTVGIPTQDLGELNTSGGPYQAEFDPLHHQPQDVSLEALLAGGREGEGDGGGRHRGRRGAAFVVPGVGRLGRGQQVVRGLGEVQQLVEVLAHVWTGTRGEERGGRETELDQQNRNKTRSRRFL